MCFKCRGTIRHIFNTNIKQMFGANLMRAIRLIALIPIRTNRKTDLICWGFLNPK